MAYEASQPNKNPGKQIDLDFSKKPEKTFEQERKEMAELIGLMDESKLTKKDGKWYVGYLTVNEYLGTMSGDDNSDMYKDKRNIN